MSAAEPTTRNADATRAGGPAPSGSARSRNFHIGIVLAGFFGLRITLWATGLRFQDHLVGQLQLIDEPLLRDDPFRAFTSLHTQPPLWNFYVGAVRRWSPLPDAFTFQMVWLIVDLATVLMVWAILCQLGARRWQATTASILVATNPFFVLAGSTLRYEPAVTFIVTATAYTLARFARSGSTRHFVAFVVLLGIGVTTRTLLQFFWLAGGIALIIGIARHRRVLRPRLIAVPVVVVCLIGADLVMVHARFGSWGYSSHVGTNLKRIAVTTLPSHRLEELIAQGTLSPGARVKPFSPYADHDVGATRCVPSGTDPALVEPTKSTGEPNLEYVCFLDLYAQDLDDAIAAIRAEPGNYLRSVAQATVIFSSRPVGFDEAGTRSFEVLDDLYEPLLVPVHIHHSFGGGDPQGVAAVFERGLSDLPLLVTVAVALVFAIARGILAAVRMLRRRGRADDPLRSWIGFTVLSVAAAAVLFDIYENARFREAIDPIVLGPFFVAVLAWVTRGVGETRRRLGPRRSPADPAASRRDRTAPTNPFTPSSTNT